VLQTWKQKFTKLVGTINKQWLVTPSHDITKFVSCFTTKVLLTGKIFRTLSGLFYFARANSARLIGKAEKVTKPIPHATTPVGVTASINKAIKHTQRTSKTEHTVRRITTKLKAVPRTVKERVKQRLQFRQSTETGHITEQNAAELRKKRPEAIKKLAQQKRLRQSITQFIRDNRVPLDRETVLNDPIFQKCNSRIKGAQIYKKNNLYYHRDTFHSGNSAHLEVYNKKGRHIGKANPITGKILYNTTDKTKKINI